MRFDTSQQMRMSQQMKLAPQMIQSMESLQMSMAELEERIEQELETNATLEVADGGDAPGASDTGDAGDTGDQLRDRADASAADAAEDAPLHVDAEHGSDDFSRLESFEASNPDAAENAFEERVSTREDEYEPRARGDEGDRDSKMDAMANTQARVGTIGEQLQEQWGLTEVKPELRALGEIIIAHIEDDGYLRTPLEQIAERAAPQGSGPRPSVQDLEHALKAVQLLLEPAGLGARDVKECLLLQVDARLDQDQSDEDRAAWTLARALVQDHLEDLRQNRQPKIASKLGVSVDALRLAVARLKTLSLAPGRQLERASEPPIVPDAFVEYDAENDRYYAYLNDRRLPNLRINQEYAKLAKDRAAPKPTRDFIRTNLSNASFLLDAIEQRKRTVLRVLEAVVAAQREFFDEGPEALRPLPMTKVAEQLGIHVATVSRAVADKYVQTPRGIVALRKFFSGGTVSTSGENAGSEVSWDAVRAALQDIIDKEDKKNPLSDDDLSEELKKRGLEIARRTVAKYRGQLNIPTGRLRKVHG
ncbi:MAG: RNA polymerase factor sigma-54 [Planctomyces sp.]